MVKNEVLTQGIKRGIYPLVRHTRVSGVIEDRRIKSSIELYKKYFKTQYIESRGGNLLLFESCKSIELRGGKDNLRIESTPHLGLNSLKYSRQGKNLTFNFEIGKINQFFAPYYNLSDLSILLYGSREVGFSISFNLRTYQQLSRTFFIKAQEGKTNGEFLNNPIPEAEGMEILQEIAAPLEGVDSVLGQNNHEYLFDYYANSVPLSFEEKVLCPVEDYTRSINYLPSSEAKRFVDSNQKFKQLTKSVEIEESQQKTIEETLSIGEERIVALEENKKYLEMDEKEYSDFFEKLLLDQMKLKEKLNQELEETASEYDKLSIVKKLERTETLAKFHREKKNVFLEERAEDRLNKEKGGGDDVKFLGPE